MLSCPSRYIHLLSQLYLYGFHHRALLFRNVKQLLYHVIVNLEFYHWFSDVLGGSRRFDVSGFSFVCFVVLKLLGGFVVNCRVFATL